MENQECQIDTKQFVSLLTANQRRIYGFILSRVPRIVESEEIMQETTTVMWQKFSTFTSDTDFVAWGIQIARNKIMDHCKKSKKQMLQLSDGAIKALEKKPLKQPVRDEVRIQLLKSCLKKLSRPQQQLVLMRYYQDASVKTIAERVGKSIPYLYKLLGRIHNTLLRCVRLTLVQGENTHV